MDNTEDKVAEVQVVKSFAFFRSIWETGQKLTDVQRHRLYDAIADYAFTNEVPSFDDDLILDLCWTNIRPNITASVRRSLDGSRGGRGNKKSVEKGTKKGGSKATSKASSKAPNKSETPIPSSPVTSYPIPSSPNPLTEEGGYDIPYSGRYDEMSFADDDIEF